MSPSRVCVVVMLTAMVMGASSSSAFAQVQAQSFREEVVPTKEKQDKIDFFYKASRFYLAGATQLDMISTYRVLHHPTVAYGADGTVLARYYGTENGWAGHFGRRNTFAAVSANVALNVGVDLLSRKLYRKGGRWRTLAIVVNGLKATDNLIAGVHNVTYNAGVDGRVRAFTGYSGPIHWSR